ncbi:hypothetical protein CLOACE_01860 [Clostridium acetireducens DSM 10703]|uniref:Uncharacterized protein n=1 Tax=Clostridium acetireducens DSM 10703 TaxID=1121290 RepID=A0A1E8F222_9CLOT|nr:hypothetical protein [Clostridium acetireducens]OFI07582.1 hypothetical protein CLOACE_01860 [Clostridium acetireducens DSM 10703]
MENLNFLPKWYIKKKINLYNKKLKLFIIIVFLINIFLCCVLIKNINNLNYLNKQIKKQFEINDNLKNKKENNNKKTTAINNFENFYNGMYKNLNCKRIFIKDDSIELEIYLKNKEDYIGVIQYIELNKKYKILNLTALTKEEEYFKFNILLGVNEHV